MDEELAALVDRWRDGSLATVERAALARRLRGDPSLAARLHAELRFEGQLAGALRPDDERLWRSIDAALALAGDGHVAEGVLRRLRARRQPTRWWWATVAAAAALLLFVGGLAIATRHQPPGVSVAIADEGVEATERQPVAMASPLTCGDDQHAQLAFSDGSRVEVGASSVVQVASVDRGGAQVELTRGSLQAVIAKQPAGAHFVVRTKEAVLTVLGTRFTATRFPWGTRVEVAEGRVLTRQIADGAELVVPAGMRLDVGADAARALMMTPLQRAAPIGAVQREPVADAIVIGGRRAHENRGKVPSHLLTSLDAPPDERREFFVRFDLAGIRRPVTSALLHLHVNHLTYVGMRLDVAVVPDAGWGEATITWDTRPQAGAVVGTWLPGPDDEPVDLTAAVNAADGVLSLRIRAAAGMPPHAVVGFNTREAVEYKRPRLVIVP